MPVIWKYHLGELKQILIGRILNKLKSTYDSNILGKIKSNIILDYDMATKDKYSNSSLIGIDYKKNTDNKSFDDLINEKNQK